MRADLVAGALWLVLGLLTIQQAWVMDRLETVGADPWSVPGLVPGIIGCVITLLALALLWRACLGHGPVAEAEGEAETAGEAGRGRWRLLVTLLLCMGFVFGLLGHGLPFWLAAAIFIALFVLLLGPAERPWPMRTAIAIGYGLVLGIAVQLLFQDLFLVRLP